MTYVVCIHEGIKHGQALDNDMAFCSVMTMKRGCT